MADLIDLGVLLHVLKAAEKTSISGDMPKKGVGRSDFVIDYFGALVFGVNWGQLYVQTPSNWGHTYKR